MSIRRRIIGATVTVLAVPSVAVLSASAASADASTPVRIVATVGPNLDPTKTVTAFCPPNGELLSPGGRVVNGGGDVILTSIVPDVTNHSVTVTARLRAIASPRVWALTAYAVCNDTATAPVVVTSGASATMSAVTASCPADTRVFGTGFALTSIGGGAFVNRVEANAGLTEVVASGEKDPAATTSLTAYAVCHPIGMYDAIKQENTLVLGSSPTFPATVTVQNPDPMVQFYGVGGRVTGPNASVTLIDALIPVPDTNEARVQVNRLQSPLGPLPLPLSAVAPGGAIAVADEVAASSTEIGTFC